MTPTYRSWTCRLLLAVFLLSIPGRDLLLAGVEERAILRTNSVVMPVNAKVPELSAAAAQIPSINAAANIQPSAENVLPAGSEQAFSAPQIQNISAEMAVPSLQHQDASAGEISNEAGKAFDSIQFSAAGSDAGGNASTGDSATDDKFIGALRQVRQPGEMLGPIDAQELGKKLALSNEQTWHTIGRLAAQGKLVHFSNAQSFVVDMPRVDPDDTPAVEGREMTLKAVTLLNSNQGVDHVVALALLNKAYLKFPKDEEDSAAVESRRQIAYLRLNAGLEVVRNAIDAQEEQYRDAGTTHKSLIAEAKTYFYNAYYDARHSPVKPLTHVVELASDAMSHADLKPYEGRPDFKDIEYGIGIAKIIAQKPAPEAAVAPAVSPEGGMSTALVPVKKEPAPAGLPQKAPILALSGVWFPNVHSGVKLTLKGEAAHLAIEKALKNGGYMVASTYLEGTLEHHATAALVRVSKFVMTGDEMVGQFDVVSTVDINKITKDKEETEFAQVSYPKITDGDTGKLGTLADTARSLVAHFGPDHEEIKPYMINRVLSEKRPEALANLFAQDLPFSTKAKQAMLSARTLEQRLETGVMEFMGMVRSKWSSEKSGASEDPSASKFPEDIEELNARMEAIGMPDNVRKVATKEFTRLQEMGPRDSEGQKIRSYVDWLLTLPWGKRAEDHYDPAEARKIMDEGHSGLEDVKDRILEYLAVRKLTGSKKGAIILFAGPKGTGKTSIAYKIAKGLGRPMVRLSLGGIKDITDLKGHNRTYLGSAPGAIIRLMREAGVNNPVFLLDEIDKMDEGANSAGAKASLLEILDGKQRETYGDTYMEVPYDLSNVLWIVTANQLETIPEPLLDRMELIEFQGYTPIEKMGILKNHILGEKAVENGLTSGQVKVTDAALKRIIEGYTREAGVRKLYEQVDKLFRKIAAWSVTKGEPIPAVVDSGDLRKYLGVEKYRMDDTMSNGVGVMTGLAVTGDVGGSTLNIEVIAMPGKGELVVTGNLKQVMSESTRVAFDFVRSRAKQLGIPDDYFQKNDVHVHFPDGATPKDGPSAGLAIAAAIASRATGRPIKPGYAMTGEISLTGEAKVIGGLPQKTMGAHRAGMHTVIYPAENEKDVMKIPEEVRKEIKLVSVKNADEVLELLLEPAPAAVAAPTTTQAAQAWSWWKPWTWPIFKRAK